jgi:hypothetical protein
MAGGSKRATSRLAGICKASLRRFLCPVPEPGGQSGFRMQHTHAAVWKLLLAGPPRFAANDAPKSRRKSCPPENGRTSFATCEFVLLNEGRISVDSQLSASSLPLSSSMQRVEARRVDQAHASQNMGNGGLSRCSRARSLHPGAGALQYL